MPKYKHIKAVSNRLFKQRSQARGQSSAFIPSITPTECANTEHNSHEFQTTCSQSETSKESSINTHSTYIPDEVTGSEQYFCDSSMSSDEEEEDVQGFLRWWTNIHNIGLNALSDLLKFMQRNGFPNLPSDSRTLLKTPTQRNIIAIPPGNYCHIGLVKAINYFVQSCQIVPDELTVDLNIDGVPLSRSSTNCFWLILAKFNATDRISKVFVVGVYNGYQKPKSFNDFLNPLICELKNIQAYTFNNNIITVKIRCIICDAPARNSCLATKSYNGYFGCGRCVQEGVYDNHRMTFPESNALKRTDSSFRSKNQPDHHIDTSPFLELPINMINQFPLDYLHLVCLGVVKKMVGMWLSGDLRARLPNNDIQTISNRLIDLSESQPCEFQRKSRSLKEFYNFKGTEFRTLIVYTLPVVLKNVLPLDKYNHLLTLHVAILILIDPFLCKSQADTAQTLLEHFVTTFSEIYGSHHVVYNVHSLTHMVEDVKLYGCLDNYSAFPFESHMSVIKRKLHKNNQQLAQICNRIEEMYLHTIEEKTISREIVFKNQDHTQKHIYREIIFDNFKINCKRRNKWFQTDDGKVFQFIYVEKKHDGTKVVKAREVQKLEPFYSLPIKSSYFNIYISDGKLTLPVYINISSIKSKIFEMKLENNFIYAPLRHSSTV